MGRAVLYRDFVTILWGASMQYITKLATSQSQKPRSPPPKKKFFFMNQFPSKISCRLALRSVWTNEYISIFSYLFALKPFKFTCMKKQLSFIWRLTNSWLAFYFPKTPITSPLAMRYALNSYWEFSTLERGEWHPCFRSQPVGGDDKALVRRGPRKPASPVGGGYHGLWLAQEPAGPRNRTFICIPGRYRLVFRMLLM